MVEAARLGQLSTVRKLLDGGAATVDDQDEVKCMCVCLYACVCFVLVLTDCYNCGLSLNSMHACHVNVCNNNLWHTIFRQ